VIGGDWVAHPSNTAARRILVTYSFLVAVSGVGSPEPPGIRINKFILCPILSPSTHRMLLQTKSADLESFVVSMQARNEFSKPSTEMGLTQWPRAARSTTCGQDRCVYVILHISSWRYGCIVTLFWCINDDCNLCVCDFASQETCFCDYLYAVQFFVWFSYSLAQLVIISTVWQINLFLSEFLM
jgi:hypothetical protein